MKKKNWKSIVRNFCCAWFGATGILVTIVTGGVLFADFVAWDLNLFLNAELWALWRFCIASGFILSLLFTIAAADVLDT